MIIISKLYKKYQEPILYALFGAATTILNWVVYVLFLFIMPMTASNAVAWVITIIFAFITNKKYVFKSHVNDFRKVFKEASMFLAARLFSAVVEIGGLPLLVYIGLDHEILGIDGAVAKLITNFIVIVLNYIFSKFAVFPKSKDKDDKLKSEEVQ